MCSTQTNVNVSVILREPSLQTNQFDWTTRRSRLFPFCLLNSILLTKSACGQGRWRTLRLCAAYAAAMCSAIEHHWLTPQQHAAEPSATLAITVTAPAAALLLITVTAPGALPAAVVLINADIRSIDMLSKERSTGAGERFVDPSRRVSRAYAWRGDHTMCT